MVARIVLGIAFGLGLTGVYLEFISWATFVILLALLGVGILVSDAERKLTKLVPLRYLVRRELRDN